MALIGMPFYYYCSFLNLGKFGSFRILQENSRKTLSVEVSGGVATGIDPEPVDDDHTSGVVKATI